MNRVVVAGSRTFNNFALMREKMDNILSQLEGSITIISGTAKGADTLGEKYAKSRGYRVVRFPADWERHGRRAGPLRNQEMADNATHVVVFWDGESGGSKNMIDEARKRGLPLRVVRY